MPRGGDRQPIARPERLSDELPLLLWRAMAATSDDAGVRFNRERTALSDRWRRLASVLAEYESHRSRAPASLRELDQWLAVVSAPTARWLPARPLPAAESTEDKRRNEVIARFSCERVMESLGTYPSDDDVVILNALYEWLMEAVPSRARSRVSSRRVVRRYLDEVRQFTRQWGLDAWWAVPLVVHEHLFLSWFGTEGLDLHVPAARQVDRYRLIARLPGRTDEEFAEDATRFGSAMLKATIETHGGPMRMALPLSREELAEIERSEDAACVILDWDPGSARDPASLLQRECEKRLGRALSSYEHRALRRQVDPQIEKARVWFFERDWRPRPRADRLEQAQIVARRLLDPATSWSEMSGGPDLAPPIFARAQNFAKEAGLTLP